ncbi:MAG: glycosyltransferase [bacterium]
MHPDRPLRVAVIANANLPIPPYFGYGGTQRGVYDFLVELNRKGHRCTLYAPLSSQVAHLENVTLRGELPVGLWEPGNSYTAAERVVWNERFIDYAVRDVGAQDFDIVNVRSDDPLLLDRLLETRHGRRLVYSLHNVRSMATLRPIVERRVQCVAHCANHRRQYGELDNIRVITYGINALEYPFSSKSLRHSSEEPTLPLLRLLKDRGQDYLIVLGSIRPEKGQRTAIELARRAGIPLVIAGTPERRSSDQFVRYFERFVKPAVDNSQVFYFGNACEDDKQELLKFAKGFLFPSGYEDRRWEEPFGRAPVEAMACGTPVIAFAHGSMLEIIEPGISGYLFSTFDEALLQVGQVEQLDRAATRRCAVTRFDRRRVADEYEALFYQLTAPPPALIQASWPVETAQAAMLTS